MNYSSRALRWRTCPQRPCFLRSQVLTRESRVLPHVSHQKRSTSSAAQYGYYENNIESLYAYSPGGYHPVQITDRLNERYRVVHKLGHGAFSTAWLALDEQTSKYVAIKVSIADADTCEVDVLSQLTARLATGSSTAEKALSSMIPRVLDQFSIVGPNGTHLCFVRLPARCSLRDAKNEESWVSLLQLDVARSLAAQLVMAVSFIHSQGYAHGDLHLGNMLLHLPSSLDSLSIDQFYAQYGPPDPEPVVRLDGKPPSSVPGLPSHVIPPVWLGKPSEDITLAEAKLMLIDFGVAFRPADKTRFESNSPLIFRPPEATFEPTTPLSFSADIWTLGCLLFELVAHRSLIDGMIAPRSEITAQQIHLQGPLPPEWWDKYEDRSRWFDEAQRAISNECDIWRWDRRFEKWIQAPRSVKKMEVLTEEEGAAFLDMLRWILAWKPQDRPTADEILDAAWMKNWALPAYERAQRAWA